MLCGAPACYADAAGKDKPEELKEEGKYFVELIPVNRPAPGRMQRITLALECVNAAGNAAPCRGNPPYPLAVGAPFAVSASSDQGLPVTLNILAVPGGAAANPSPGHPNVYIPRAPGKLVFEAVQAGVAGAGIAGGSRGIAAAPTMTLELDITIDPSSTPSECAEFTIPRAREEAPGMEAAAIVRLLGDPAPFILEAQGKNAIAVYSKRAAGPKPDAVLADIRAQVAQLAAMSPEQLGIAPSSEPFTLEIAVPHAAALGDLKDRVAALGYSQFPAQSVGPDKIRITAPSRPNCEDWRAFLADLRHVVWQLHPEPSSVRLFYLNAADASAALNAGGTAPAAAKSPAAPTAAGAPVKDGGAGPAKSAASAATPPPPTGKPAPVTSTAAPSQSAGVSIAPLNADWLVLSDSHPGDDAAVAEKRRVLAALDIPKPEMIISAWVLQNSSTDPASVGNFNDIVQRLVAQNNEALQSGILSAWRYLKGQMTPQYFDEPFYRYVVNRYAADLPRLGESTAAAARDVLEDRSLARSEPVERRKFGFCGREEYCLGYVNLFLPLQPRLTDLLLAVIAAKYPLCQAENAAEQIEGTATSKTACTDSAETRAEEREVAGNAPMPAPADGFQKQLLRRLALDDARLVTESCENRDLTDLIAAASPGGAAHLRLNCFRQVARQWLNSGAAQDSSAPPSGSPTPVGLMRAAIADFLFHYKLSQQYPHEYSSYDLGRSADTLNSALRPVIDAFNLDVGIFQSFLGAELQVQVDAFNSDHKSWARLLKDKPKFLNNGLVTVRTISGQESSVDSVSQSFLDASSAPAISDLANSILGASSPMGTSGSGSAAVGRILENLSPNQAQAALGALGAYQSSKIQIGRELLVDVTPRSLNGAAAAEIAVTLRAGEPATPNYYGGSRNGAAADLSRVGAHHTTSRIRVDSIRIFDVSSYAAVLERAHSRFPLLPPFVEIPYIGTLLGIPLPPATEYHSSTALLSAMIVPTAADLAAGLVFRQDQVVDALNAESCIWPGEPNAPRGAPDRRPYCGIRAAVSLGDLNGEPITEFHRAKMQCFATNGRASNWTAEGAANNDCAALTFDQVLHPAP